MHISSNYQRCAYLPTVFNISKIFQYHSELLATDDIPTLSFSDAHRDDTNQIEDIMDIRKLATRQGMTKHYLVWLSEQPITNCTWVDGSELRY